MLLFLTDGHYECFVEGEGEDGFAYNTTLTDPALRAEVLRAGVRVVTGAFG